MISQGLSAEIQSHVPSPVPTLLPTRWGGAPLPFSLGSLHMNLEPFVLFTISYCIIIIEWLEKASIFFTLSWNPAVCDRLRMPLNECTCTPLAARSRPPGSLLDLGSRACWDKGRFSTVMTTHVPRNPVIAPSPDLLMSHARPIGQSTSHGDPKARPGEVTSPPEATGVLPAKHRSMGCSVLFWGESGRL